MPSHALTGVIVAVLLSASSAFAERRRAFDRWFRGGCDRGHRSARRRGGYTTAGKAFATLTSDGSGGSLLSLGADGSIDLLGAPKSSLHVTNFKIG